VSPRLSFGPVNRPFRRLLALLCAMFPLLSGAGDAFGAHACPHHAAIAAPEYATSVSADADRHGGHASHEGMPASAPEHDGHDACTCGGVCPVSTGPAPLAAAWLIRVPLVLPYAAPAAHPDPTGLPSRLAPYLLPFAQAPPLPA
jgi:hypothetical protein